MSKLTRRHFVRAAVPTVAAGFATCLYTAFVEPHWLDITERPLPVRGLPEGLQGRTLAFLSDLHIGPRVSDDYLLETFRRINERKPDIVAYGGDFISYNNAALNKLDHLLPSAPRGALGTVGI